MDNSFRNEYEITVIGAGPSGSCAALFLSQLGMKTLLLEKKSAIGVPVRCGEFLPELNNLKKLIPKTSLVETIYSLIPPEAVACRTDIIRFYSPRSQCFEFKFDGLVLKRELVEQSITKKAEEYGAEVKINSTVKHISYKNGSAKILIDSHNGESVVKSKVVIGADGFPSQVASWAGMKNRYNKADISLTVQNVMNNADVNESEIEMYTGNKYAPLGYSWIIPKGKKVANVGLGVRMTYPRRPDKSVRSLLEYFIHKHPIASRKLSKAQPLPLVGKMLPIAGIAKQIVRNNTLLVGDAAGLVIATNGGGIPTAMISGVIAANVASKFCRGEYELNIYEKLLRDEIGSIIGLSVAYRVLADKFMRSDFLFDKLLRTVGTKGVSKVLRCERTALGTFLQKLLEK